ncbi:hypothetical protein AVEN_192764-1, partial [Araneus ventricosus]
SRLPFTRVDQLPVRMVGGFLKIVRFVCSPGCRVRLHVSTNVLRHEDGLGICREKANVFME